MQKPKLAAALGVGVLAAIGMTVISNSRATATTTVAAPAAAPTAGASGPIAFTLSLAPAKNSARYFVHEQLVGFDLPSEAIGETRSVTGSIAFDSAGRIVSSASRIEVGIASLTSDSQRRDGFIRARILETDRYPNVVFLPSSTQGLPLPLPRSGKRTFNLAGNLTIRAVTRPVTWTVNATFSDCTITGTAATSFAFADFSLTQPRVPVVLSVADSIRLEHQFTLTR